MSVLKRKRAKVPVGSKRPVRKYKEFFHHHDSIWRLFLFSLTSLSLFLYLDLKYVCVGVKSIKGRTCVHDWEVNLPISDGLSSSSYFLPSPHLIFVFIGSLV